MIFIRFCIWEINAKAINFCGVMILFLKLAIVIDSGISQECWRIKIHASSFVDRELQDKFDYSIFPSWTRYTISIGSAIT